MRHPLFFCLPLFCVLCVIFLSSCEEVKEASIYDNWKERNQAVADSLFRAASGHFFTEGADVDSMEVDETFAIPTAASTNKKMAYVFCKKLVKNVEADRPYYTDMISVHYCGSDINGKIFDKTFMGYTFADRTYSPSTVKPTEFDKPTMAKPSDFIEGWITALQYMHEGERWMIYVPYESGYGEKDYSSIMGYSLLTFDIYIEDIVTLH